jgi:hypothetical protein
MEMQEPTQEMKDMQKLFRHKIRQAMRDVAERCTELDMENRVKAAIIGTELLASTAEVMGKLTRLGVEEIGLMLATGVRLVRLEEAERKQQENK